MLSATFQPTFAEEVSWTQPSYIISTVNPNKLVMGSQVGNKLSELKGSPVSFDFDPDNNMYIVDRFKWIIKVNMTSGIITGSTTETESVSDLAVKKNGEVFLVGGLKLKKINSDGTVSIYNNNAFENVNNNIGDGGKAINSKVFSVQGVAVNSKEEIIFSDSARIRKIFNNGTITTIAGNGNNNPPAANTISQPKQLCVDLMDNVIFIDNSRLIKKLSTNGAISIVAGTIGGSGEIPPDGSFANSTGISPISVAIHPFTGEVYFATSKTISRIDSEGRIVRVAGNGTITDDSAPHLASDTVFSSIAHISFKKNNDLYIADNLRVKRISSLLIFLEKTETAVITSVHSFGDYVYYTVSCQIMKFSEGVASETSVVMGSRGSCGQMFGVPRKVDATQPYLLIDTISSFTFSQSSGRMYYATPRRMWNVTDGYVYPMIYNYGENIDIKDGLIDHSVGACLDNSENLILGDNFRLRLLNTTSRIVKTIVGNNTPMVPFTCSVDTSNGDIYFKDNQDIKKWSSSTGEVSSLTKVQFDHRHNTYKIKVLSSGALIYTDRQYILSYYKGQKTTIAGKSETGSFSGEGGLATNAVQGAFLVGLTANSKGEIYYADIPLSGDTDIRKLTPFCTDPNTYLDSTGTKCMVRSCFGVEFNRNSVCSGYGTCSSQNNCTCNDGYFGSNCEKFTCFGFNNTDPKACSGNGTCTNLDTCSCNFGYQPECKDYVCFGYNMDDLRVCSSHGSCIGINNCSCSDPYYGSNCEKYDCFGIPASNTTSVCNGNGQCTAPNTCSCQFGFYPQCYAPKCFGKLFNDITSCSSVGNCTDDNVCECMSGRNGIECEFITLSFSLKGRPSLKTTYIDKFYPNSPIDSCKTIFQDTELKMLGTDPICKFTASGLLILLGSSFSIRNDSILPSKLIGNYQFNFKVLSGSICAEYTQSSLNLDLRIQTSSLQNTNSETVLRLSETDVSQLFGRSVYWSGSTDFTPLVSPNQKIVIIPKGYWNQTTLPLTIYTKNSMCGISSISRTFTFKTDNSPFIDFMTETPSAKLNCVGYDCLVEFSISPSGSYKPQIKFDGDYSPIIISSNNMQIVRLSNYYESTTYLRTRYYGTMSLELLFNGIEKQSISYPMSYVAFDRSQLFINNLNRGFSKDQAFITFDLISQNPLLFLVNPSVYQFSWIISNSNRTIANSLSNFITIPNPGVGDYSLNFLIRNDGLEETLNGAFSVLDVVGSIPDIILESFTTPYPFVKTLDLKAIVNSTTSVRIHTWNVISGSFYNSPMLSNFVTSSPLSQNNIKTMLSIPVEYLKEGESYTFSLTVTNHHGANEQRIYVKMDYNPRFSCDYYTTYNSSELKIFDTKMILSCDSFENNLASYVVDLCTPDMKKLMTLSNTVKSSVITRLPYSSTGLSFVIKAINRNGSFRTIVKPISGQFFNTPSSDISSRVSYISQQWAKLKTENIKMDTASSIFSLVTYLQNGKDTFEDFSGMSDPIKTTLTTVITEMITTLKTITTIGYRADDKIAAVILSPTLRIVKLVKSVLPTVFESNQKTDIQLLTSFIVKGIESVTGYYSNNVVRALVDGVTFNETISLVQNVYSSFSTSGLFSELTRLQLSVNPDVSPLNLVSYQSPQEISGKTIPLSATIRFTFPENFYSQLPSIPFSLISSQEQSDKVDAVAPTITISLFKTDGSVLKIQQLTNYIEIVFTNLELKTDNVSCVYFDEVTKLWSTEGLITTVTKLSGSSYNVKCDTNHLTAFSVIANAAQPIIINPFTSFAKNDTRTDSTLAIALGVSIPLVLLIVLVIVVVIIVLLVVCLRKHKGTPQEGVYEQPSVSAYQTMNTSDSFVGTELSDFPSNNSMFMKPLMSVYNSTGSNSSTSSKFDPMSRYKNLVRIGQGAFGSVFKAEDSKCNNRLKAIKVIKYSSVEELNNILKEGSRLMNISHPYILHVNDVLIDSDQILCIDMDYYEKGDLHQFVKVGSECPEKIIKQILYQMCNALDYVHNTLQIIHRDIKPSNIFIKDISADSIHLILADFGLARQTQGSVMFSYAGTPLFMSTELALGSKYTANTDIYSLGVTLYQIITKDVETSLSHLSLTLDNAEFEKNVKNKMKEANSSLSDTLLDIVVSMLKRDNATRPYPRDILANHYFSDSI